MGRRRIEYQGVTRPARLRSFRRGILALAAIVLAGLISSPAQSETSGAADRTVESTRLDGIVVHILPIDDTPDDGYWRWLVRYVDDSERAENRIDQIRRSLSVMAKQAADLRASWMSFFREEYARRDSITTEPVLRAERNRIKNEIDGLKRAQGPLIDEALRLLEDLYKSVQAQLKRSEDRRPQLKGEADYLSGLRTLLKIELYDAAEWHREDELLRLIKELDVAKTSEPEVARFYGVKARLADAKNLERRLLLQQLAPNRAPVDQPLVMAIRTQRLEALKELRSLASERPDLDNFRVLLQEQELYWVRLVAKKVERERNLNLAAFQRYLSERGFSADDNGGWPQAVMEFFSAWWGLGPIALSAGIYDVPGTQADQVGIVQKQAVENLVALNAIIRLIKNGIPLTDVPSITVEKLANNVSLRQADRRPLATDKARRLVQDILKTINQDLPDLRALASSDPYAYFLFDVQDAFAADYFDAIDSNYHAYEYFGDIWNVRNLVTFWGPGAITRSAGNKWGFATSAEIAAAHAEGATVGHRIFAASGLKALGESLNQTKAGQRMAAMLARRRDIAAAVGKATTAAWRAGNYTQAALKGSAYAMGTVNNIAAVIGTMMGAHYLAAMTGLPPLVMLVDMINIFQLDAHFFEVAFRSNIPLGKIAGKLDDVTRQIERERRSLARIRQALEDVGETGAGRAASTTYRPSAVPRAQVEAAEHAANSATRAKVGADVAEARRATRAGRTFVKKAEGQLDDLSQKVARANRRVSAASKASARLKGLSVSRLPKAKSIDADTAKIGKRFYNQKFYGGIGGPAIREGDLALQADDLEEALKHYRRARRQAVKSARVDRDLQDFLEGRVALVANARKSRKEILALRARAPKILKAKQPITSADETWVRSQIKDGNIKHIGGGANPIFVVEDTAGNKFLIKKMEASPTAEEVLRNAKRRLKKALESGDQAGQEAARKAVKQALRDTADSSEEKVKRELFGSVVMNEMGLNAPANRRLKASELEVSYEKLVTNDAGQEVLETVKENLEHAVIVRPVEGMEELMSKTEAELLALRKDIAEQRAVRALMGDSDGHLRNLAVDKNGVFWNIDFDNASVDGNKLSQILGSNYNSEAELIEATVLLAHGRDPGSRSLVYGAMRKSGLYSPMARADEMVRLDDMIEQFNKIENFSTGAMKQRFRAAGFNDDEAQSLVDLLQSRKMKVRPSLSKDSLFGGGPIRSGWFLNPLHPRHAGDLEATPRMPHVLAAEIVHFVPYGTRAAEWQSFKEAA